MGPMLVVVWRDQAGKWPKPERDKDPGLYWLLSALKPLKRPSDFYYRYVLCFSGELFQFGPLAAGLFCLANCFDRFSFCYRRIWTHMDGTQPGALPRFPWCLPRSCSRVTTTAHLNSNFMAKTVAYYSTPSFIWKLCDASPSGFPLLPSGFPLFPRVPHPVFHCSLSGFPLFRVPLSI